VSPKRSIAQKSYVQATNRSGTEALSDEGEFLRHSIEDLEDERACGEVDDSDYLLLCSRYEKRLIEVETALVQSAIEVAPGMSPDDHVASPHKALRARGIRRRLGNSRVRLLIAVAAAGCFVVAATLLAVSFAGVRLPGESATGSVSLSSAQQEQETLDRAAVLGSEGQAAEAVQLYDEVLQTDPNQPDALAYGGWLVRLAGLSSKNRLVVAKGDASVARAVKVAPRYPDAHALLGVIYYEDFARPDAAVAQFRAALAVGASESLLEGVAPVAQEAYAAARQALPRRYLTASKKASAAAAR
jgi:tetratricopeptide (TPR) repeat protein